MGKILGYRKYRPRTQPAYDYPPYASTAKRHPTRPLVIVPQTLSEVTGPLFGYDEVRPTDNDLVRPAPEKLGSSGASCRSVLCG